MGKIAFKYLSILLFTFTFATIFVLHHLLDNKYEVPNNNINNLNSNNVINNRDDRSARNLAREDILDVFIIPHSHCGTFV